MKFNNIIFIFLVLFFTSCSVTKKTVTVNGTRFPANSTTYINNSEIEQRSDFYTTFTSGFILHSPGQRKFTVDQFGNLVGDLESTTPNIKVPKMAPVLDDENKQVGDLTREFYAGVTSQTRGDTNINFPSEIVVEINYPGQTLSLTFIYVKKDESGVFWYGIKVLTSADYPGLEDKKNVYQDELKNLYWHSDKDYYMISSPNGELLIEKQVALGLFLENFEIILKDNQTVTAISKNKEITYYFKNGKLISKPKKKKKKR